MPTVQPGDAVALTADEMGTRPKWIEWTSAGNAGGSAKLPSGHRRLVSITGTTRTEADYYVAPVGIADTDSDWRAVIFADNGSYIYADGLTGIPTVGTPHVRLLADAPAKAVLQIPVRRGTANFLDAGFDGWSDGHAEAVARGMELTVEYRRPDGTMATVFRGQIYQVASGEAITLTAYDRLMDLYQFSDQYQSHQGQRQQTINRYDITGTAYQYIASAEPGAVQLAITTSDILISALHHNSQYQYSRYASWVFHNLPGFSGTNIVTGDRIKKLMYSAKPYKNPDGEGSNAGTCYYRVGIFRKDDTDPNNIRMETVWMGELKTLAWGSADTLLTWILDWEVPAGASDYFIGYGYENSDTGLHAQYFVGVGEPSSRYTISTAYSAYDVMPVANPSFTDMRVLIASGSEPEVAVEFDHQDTIPNTDITATGTTVNVPLADVTAPSGDCISTPDPGYQLYIDYQVLLGTDLLGIVEELVKAAGLVPDLEAGASIGATTYYQTSTYDFLTCVQEIVRGGSYGIRASIAEPGKAEIYPKYTIDDTTVADFTTAPDGAGERSILSHSLTSHWMAEKATQAIIAENATDSGFPIALETDDLLIPGSLCRALQSPLRGVTADNTMGTHLLMATAAGGKVVQLHTNVFEGDITLGGYRTDIWMLAGDHVGGKPIGITVPEYGATGTAVPTSIEFGDGVTLISLDNIRGADRSEAARSMGLTADALSNTASALPATCYIFARFDDYDTQETGLTPDTVSLVEFLQNGGTVAASQSDGTYIKTVEDLAGYYHVAAVLPASVYGYAATDPIAAVRITMGGTTYTAVLDNPKYALAGQMIHADLRFRKA